MSRSAAKQSRSQHCERSCLSCRGAAYGKLRIQGTGMISESMKVYHVAHNGLRLALGTKVQLGWRSIAEQGH